MPLGSWLRCSWALALGSLAARAPGAPRFAPPGEGDLVQPLIPGAAAARPQDHQQQELLPQRLARRGGGMAQQQPSRYRPPTCF